MPKISVVIPCYNAERYLHECLDSVVNQTLDDIEVIIVNDASTDGSTEIIRGYARGDARVRVIEHEKNQGESQSRKDGVLAVTGDHVLFLDSDDYLDLGACEGLHEMVHEHDVDILHFATSVVTDSPVESEYVRGLENWMRPLDNTLHGTDVLDMAFGESPQFGQSIWDKMYSARLCQRVFTQIPDGDFPYAADKLAFFLLAYFASSYRGVPDRTYYNYRFGAGVSGSGRVELARFETFCKSAWVADKLDEFAEATGSPSCVAAARRVRLTILRDCLRKWYLRVSPEDWSGGFDLIVSYWPLTDVVSVMGELLSEHQTEVVEKVPGDQLPNTNPPEVGLRSTQDEALAASVDDRLEAILKSRSWRFTQALLTPVRAARMALAALRGKADRFRLFG